MQVQVLLTGTPEHPGCKGFPLKTGLCYVQIPFKTGLTVF